MKHFRKICIAYVLFMALSLVILLIRLRSIRLLKLQVNEYSDQELEVYKKIWDGINESVHYQELQIIKYILVFWVILLIMGLIVFFVIYRNELMPVSELEKCASEIAKGNLDVALPMHKNNIFGSFAESFDLMRTEMKRSRERELQAEHARKELVAELSHDLKTPVATIQATCEVLELTNLRRLEAMDKSGDGAILVERKAIENTLEKIGYIENKSETINQLIQNVQKANTDDLEGLQVNPVETDSREIERFFESLKSYGNIVLTNHIPECLVMIDYLRMEQVVDNIVSNSYKYAGTDIQVSFEETEAVPQMNGKSISFIKITIRDSGKGVTEDELPLIVEKYYRGGNSEGKAGYGLGLYLVKWYMEKQGGGMEYYNSNGFVVELLVRKV